MQPTFLLPTLLSVTTAWSHKPNTPFCTPTGPNVCNFGWEYFWDTSTRQKSYAAWVYDRYCNVIGDYTREVPGYIALQPGPGIGDTTKTLYHVDTSRYLGADVIMTDVVVVDTMWKYPVFEYGGMTHGGPKHCSCGMKGLDVHGTWVCQCAFDC